MKKRNIQAVAFTYFSKLVEKTVVFNYYHPYVLINIQNRRIVSNYRTHKHDILNFSMSGTQLQKIIQLAQKISKNSCLLAHTEGEVTSLMSLK